MKREFRTSDGSITGLIKNSESITLDELDDRRQRRDSAQRKARELAALRLVTSTLRGALDVLTEQQRQQSLVELFERVDRSVRGPAPKAAEPDELERYIMREAPDFPAWMR